jgi:hypothetical protein
MILDYIGYSISIILAISSVVLFVASIYVRIKDLYLTKLNLTENSLKTGNMYTIFSILFFLLSVFMFLTTENGFSWGDLLFFLLIMIAFLVFMGIDYSIRRRSLNYINKHKISVPSVLRDYSITSVLKNRHIENKTEIGKKKKD